MYFYCTTLLVGIFYLLYNILDDFIIVLEPTNSLNDKHTVPSENPKIHDYSITNYCAMYLHILFNIYEVLLSSNEAPRSGKKIIKNKLLPPNFIAYDLQTP